MLQALASSWLKTKLQEIAGKAMRKPRIFIASSAESLDVADAFNVNFDHQAEVTVWKHGFALSQTTIESLVQMADTVDFAIFIFTPDDVARIREKEKQVTRDNVVYELGLFTGTLGKDRCFIVKPRDIDLHLPTDLLGLTAADYDGNRSDNNLEAAVNHPSVLIKKRVAELGLVSQDLDIQKKIRRKVGYNYKVGDTEHLILTKILESYARSPEGVAAHLVFNEIKGISEGHLSLALIKLERLGYLDKSIVEDGQYEYYGFSITADGIDYLLENEESLPKMESISPQPKTPVDDFDGDIPF
ncbi:TIR domain-containing protein [Ectothiorhodospira shaposhnikovii]|uniref:TIR domain-containing protein n=1 Tax=Ectothiorhodospira shaposhnikovii TaxID=1054 RepID=UPI001904F0CE|nr:nucleotide-binding protein [Ectothiorhodospira shaposhnikovii]